MKMRTCNNNHSPITFEYISECDLCPLCEAKDFIHEDMFIINDLRDEIEEYKVDIKNLELDYDDLHEKFDKENLMNKK